MEEEVKIKEDSVKSHKRLYVWLVIIFLSLTAVPIIAEFMIGDTGYIPKGEALGEDKRLLWFHVITDILIGVAYMSIPITLIMLKKKAGKRLPFGWVFVMFGLFIVACGFTHFLGAWIVWEPWYYVEGAIQYFTVVISLATALAIIPLSPKVLKLLEDAESFNSQVKETEKSNSELKKVKEQLEAKVDELEETKKALVNALDELGEERKDLSPQKKAIKIVKKSVAKKVEG